MFKKILFILTLQQAFIIYFDGIIPFKVDENNFHNFKQLCQLANSNNNNVQFKKVAVNILNLAIEKINKGEVSQEETKLFMDFTNKLKDIFMCICPLRNPWIIDIMKKEECWDADLEAIFDPVEDYTQSIKSKKFQDIFVNEVIQNSQFKNDFVDLICHTEVQDVLVKDCKELKCHFVTARFFFLSFYLFDVRCFLWSLLK